jgi:hypothetical protein
MMADSACLHDSGRSLSAAEWRASGPSPPTTYQGSCRPPIAPRVLAERQPHPSSRADAAPTRDTEGTGPRSPGRERGAHGPRTSAVATRPKHDAGPATLRRACQRHARGRACSHRIVSLAVARILGQPQDSQAAADHTRHSGAGRHQGVAKPPSSRSASPTRRPAQMPRHSAAPKARDPGHVATGYATGQSWATSEWFY